VIANGAPERSQTYIYDDLARLIETDTTQQIGPGSTRSYVETIAYDTYYGWPKSIGYPNGEGVGTYYSKYGQPIANFNPGDTTACVWVSPRRSLVRLRCSPMVCGDSA